MRRWRKWVSCVLVGTALVGMAGCGGGGGGGDSEAENRACYLQEYNKTNLPSIPEFTYFDGNTFYYQQWAIHYDSNFARDNNISSEASIHMDADHNFLGRKIKVAVIDSGLQVDHEDLQGVVVKTYDVKTGSEDVSPPNEYLIHGHEVTGVIAARNNSFGMVGVAPEVEIYFIRLPFEDGSMPTSYIVDAFEKAKEWNVDVINCSWGTNDVDETVQKTIEELAKKGRNGKGTIIVFAVGNEGGRMDDRDEAALDVVIGVGATDETNLRAEYSNFGPQLDVMAPGGGHIGITTLDLMGFDGIARENENYILFDDYNSYPYRVSTPFAGTSAAAPIVTGVVALLLEANPNLTRENVYNALACSADKIGNVPYGSDGFNEYYGYGKVNVHKALQLVR